MSTEKTKTGNQLLIAVGQLLLHLLLATVGVILLSDLLVWSENSIAHAIDPSITYKQASWLLTEIPGFPIQAVVGLLLGFALAAYMRRKIMIWAWVLPFALSCLAAVTSPFHNSSIFTHFLGTGCGPKNHCFDQFVAALPLIASSAYSLGAEISIVTTSYLRRNTGGKTILRQV